MSFDQKEDEEYDYEDEILDFRDSFYKIVEAYNNDLNEKNATDHYTYFNHFLTLRSHTKRVLSEPDLYTDEINLIKAILNKVNNIINDFKQLDYKEHVEEKTKLQNKINTEIKELVTDEKLKMWLPKPDNISSTITQPNQTTIQRKEHEAIDKNESINTHEDKQLVEKQLSTQTTDIQNEDTVTMSQSSSKKNDDLNNSLQSNTLYRDAINEVALYLSQNPNLKSNTIKKIQLYLNDYYENHKNPEQTWLAIKNVAAIALKNKEPLNLFNIIKPGMNNLLKLINNLDNKLNTRIDPLVKYIIDRKMILERNIEEEKNPGRTSPTARFFNNIFEDHYNIIKLKTNEENIIPIPGLIYVAPNSNNLLTTTKFLNNQGKLETKDIEFEFNDLMVTKHRDIARTLNLPNTFKDLGLEIIAERYKNLCNRINADLLNNENQFLIWLNDFNTQLNKDVVTIKRGLEENLPKQMSDIKEVCKQKKINFNELFKQAVATFVSDPVGIKYHSVLNNDLKIDMIDSEATDAIIIKPGFFNGAITQPEKTLNDRKNAQEQAFNQCNKIQHFIKALKNIDRYYIPPTGIFQINRVLASSKTPMEKIQKIETIIKKRLEIKTSNRREIVQNAYKQIGDFLEKNSPLNTEKLKSKKGKQFSNQSSKSKEIELDTFKTNNTQLNGTTALLTTAFLDNEIFKSKIPPINGDIDHANNDEIPNFLNKINQDVEGIYEIIQLSKGNINEIEKLEVILIKTQSLVVEHYNLNKIDKSDKIDNSNTDIQNIYQPTLFKLNTALELIEKIKTEHKDSNQQVVGNESKIGIRKSN